jgi:hypothetical protein
MHINYKCSVWRRLHLPDDITKEEVIEYLRKEAVEQFSSGAAFSDLRATHDDFLYDTEEDLSVIDNGGSCTVELFDDIEEVWDNVSAFKEEDFSEEIKSTIERMEDLKENRELYKGIDNEIKKGDSNE